MRRRKSLGNMNVERTVHAQEGQRVTDSHRNPVSTDVWHGAESCSQCRQDNGVVNTTDHRGWEQVSQLLPAPPTCLGY